MITYQLQGTHDILGREAHARDDIRDRAARGVRRPAPVGRRAARAAGRSRPVRGGAPATARGRGAGASALCPSPVPIAARGVAEPVAGPLRRIVAAIGLALASGVAVVGLGLLSDVASAGHADGSPASTVGVATVR